MEISIPDFGKLVGRSHQNIRDQIKKGNLVKTATGNMDTENPLNREYIRVTNPARRKYKEDLKKKHAPKTKKPRATTKKKKEVIEFDFPIPQDIEDNKQQTPGQHFQSISGLPEKMMSLTLRDLVLNYGSPMSLKTYTDILAKLMVAMKNDLQIQRERMVLIEKDFVVSQLFSFVEVLINKLFDYPDAIISQEIAEIKADEKSAAKTIPELHRKNFSKIIKECKRNINKSIKNLIKKYAEKKEDDLESDS